jgi:RNA polymerase sigma-70 factor (ECF subfamily)
MGRREGTGAGEGTPNFFTDRGSFADFYDRQYPRLIRYFARRVRDKEQVRDLTADTFLAALEHRDECRGSNEYEALGWLFKIAATQAGQSYRKGGAAKRLHDRLQLEWRPATAEEAARIDDLIDAQAAGSALEAALYDLTAEERELVIAHVVDEQTFREIAGGSAQRAETLRVKFGRTRRRLAIAMRASLEKEGDSGRS